MVEFRTEAPGSKKKDSSGIDGFVENYVNTLKSSDAAQQQLVQLVAQNDVPPALIAPLVDANPDEFQAYLEKLQKAELQQQQAEQQEAQQMEQETQPEPEKVAPDVNDILGIVDEIIDVKGEGVTLGELKEFAEKNPDTVNTLIDLQL